MVCCTDINADSVDPYTCLASGETYTTYGTDVGIVRHNGVTAIDLNNGVLVTANSGIVFGDTYTVAHWISWKQSASGWRTLFRTYPSDHVILVQQSDGDLGMFSNRDGGFYGSGSTITTDGSWQFIVATGEASSPGSSSGTTTFYRASCTSCATPTFDNLGTAPRVASGQTMR